MKEKAKKGKGKKAKVALKDLDVSKVKGGIEEEQDPKGGFLKVPMESIAHKHGGLPNFPKVGDVRFPK